MLTVSESRWGLAARCVAATGLFYVVFAVVLTLQPSFLSTKVADGDVGAKVLFVARRAGNSIQMMLLYAVAIFVVYRLMMTTAWFRRRRIADVQASPRQVAREGLLSANLLLAAALQGAVILVMAELGHAKIYASISDRGWLYAIASVAMYAVFADTWFYITHRCLHKFDFLFDKVHRVHHLSVVTTPLTNSQGSPFELLSYGLMSVVFFTQVPVAAPIISFLVVFFTLYQMLCHSGFEFYPRGTARHPIGKWIVTPTYHQMHHQLNDRHMSLYFTWWDRLFKTVSPDYEKRFDAVTSNAR